MLQVEKNIWLAIIARHKALSRIDEKHGTLNLSNYQRHGYSRACDCLDEVFKIYLDKRCDYKIITSERLNRLARKMGLYD